MTDAQLPTKLSKASLSELFTHYGAREDSGLANDVEACAALAQRALSLGEPLLAYDACGFGLQAQAGHARLGQLQGLALARCGASDQARQVLERLYAQGAHDEETIGILARVHKDLWQESTDGVLAKASLLRSLALYLEAYRQAGGYWLGINAATLALASGDTQLSTQLAASTRSQCLEEENKSSTPDKWRRATLGEAALLLGQLDEAQLWYARALEAGAGFGDRGSMRRNVRLILAARGMDASWEMPNRLRILKDYKLWLRFQDDVTGTVDLSGEPWRRMFESLATNCGNRMRT